MGADAGVLFVKVGAVSSLRSADARVLCVERGCAMSKFCRYVEALVSACITHGGGVVTECLFATNREWDES